MAKRKKYDYHYIISYFGLSKDFDLYSKFHRGISFNRQARSFLVSRHIDYKQLMFEVDSRSQRNNDIYKVVHTKWVDDE